MFHFLVAVVVLVVSPAQAQWRVLPPSDQRQALPAETPSDAAPVKPGDKWPNDDKFRWLVGDVELPESIEGKPVRDRAVGLQFSCGDGGEVHVDGRLQARYDNDHPGLVVLADQARPGRKVRVSALVYAKVQGGDSFSEARLVLIDSKRAADRLAVTVDPTRLGEAVPQGIAGLSQGGGLSDYEDATAAKLKEGGFRWFRMDNILTNALKKSADGKMEYDWTDLDRRADFIVGKMGADAIFAVSYMPQVLDAVPNDDRQSAPRDYAAWEELCFNAAKRCLDRGHRITFWEVWNEVNTGWLKPGPEDTGSESFAKLYTQALGREQPEKEVVRRFEAYCKLYRATAKGVLRADPKAKIGGPALASGPMENDKCGHCFHGKGFARGLILWCRQEKLPLDFVSWHEYFQPQDVIARQADTFRSYLEDSPDLRATVKSLMITEWNQAWWADRPHDHEIGAAWCADGITRALVPKGIDRPCFFYVKQNDTNFRGDFSLLMKDNVPKASYNVLKIFNGLSGRWIKLDLDDGEVSGVAAWDAERNRLAVVLVNFNYRYGLRRHVKLRIPELPKTLRGGQWREWLVDATHGNAWHDLKAAELTQVASGELKDGVLELDRTLLANSVTLVELTAPPRAPSR